MRCEACGLEYGGSHECTGIAHAIPEEALPPPPGICPGYYLRMAFHIAFLDVTAIRRVSRDPDALFYGAAYSTLAAVAVFLVTALHKMLTREGATSGTIFWGLLLGITFVCVYLGVIALIQVGMAHFIARTMLDGTGTFFEVLRPAFLGWFVNFLTVIPVVGPPAAALAWTAVMARVLNAVDSLSPAKSVLIAGTINASFLALQYLVPR